MLFTQKFYFLIIKSIPSMLFLMDNQVINTVISWIGYWIRIPLVRGSHFASFWKCSVLTSWILWVWHALWITISTQCATREKYNFFPLIDTRCKLIFWSLRSTPPWSCCISYLPLVGWNLQILAVIHVVKNNSYIISQLVIH